MKTREYDGEALAEPRSHPWLDGLDESAHYSDFTTNPALIRTSLEDFQPFARYPAIEQFYQLLERLNHPRSALESNDCAFIGPHASETAQVRAAIECSGRLMVMYRTLEYNTEQARVAWLTLALHRELAETDPKFTLGVIGTRRIPVRFLALPEAEQLGEQLSLSFWAFGDSEATAMQNLLRLFNNLSRALRLVSARAARGS